MKRSRIEKENVIKDVRNLFGFKKLKTRTTDIAIKDIRNLENWKTRKRLEN